VKPLKVILGLAGACAACCAIPLAAPLIAALAAGGVIVSFDEAGGLIAALGGAGLAAFLIWRYRRSQGAAHQCASGACGCAAPANTLRDPETTPITCRLTDRVN
jgi:hypothetical protein